MVKQLSLIFAAIFFLASCGQRPSNELTLGEDELEPDQLEVSGEAMNEIIQNIASPIEVAALISELNVPFSKSGPH